MIKSVLIIVALTWIVGPFLLIWSTNTLFQTQIPFDHRTWAAAFVFSLTISGGYSK